MQRRDFLSQRGNELVIIQRANIEFTGLEHLNDLRDDFICLLESWIGFHQFFERGNQLVPMIATQQGHPFTTDRDYLHGFALVRQFNNPALYRTND